MLQQKIKKEYKDHYKTMQGIEKQIEQEDQTSEEDAGQINNININANMGKTQLDS